MSSNTIFFFCLVAAALLLAAEWSTVNGSPAQTFYPNGRYGKRQLSPSALEALSSSADQTQALDELDGTSLGQPLKCHYLGYGDLFRCRSANKK